MASLLHPRDAITEAKAGSPGEAIRTQVAELLRKLYPQLAVIERRRHNRYPYPQIVHLTPFDDSGLIAADETASVVCKHLSERGLGFFHQQPLAHRKVIASLESQNGRWLAFVLDVGWCRFTRHGWYESGGRFLQTTSPPTLTIATASAQPAAVD